MRKLFLIFFIVCFPFSIYSQSCNPVLKLWYKQPADEWMKAIPIGNGRLGGMIYGGVEKEQVALNEITMWSGSHDDYQENFCGKEILNEIRKEFFAGRLIEGNKLASHFLSGTPNSFGTHVPVGDLVLNFKYKTNNITDYKRELNLQNAIASVSFKAGNVKYKREYFCSNPDDVMIIRFTADTKSSLTFDLGIKMSQDAVIETSKDNLQFSGRVKGDGVGFSGNVKAIVKGGNVQQMGNLLKIDKSDEVVLIVNIRTDYKSPSYIKLCSETIRKAMSKKYDQIKKEHIVDYKHLFNRVELDLGNNEAGNLPTDLRWARMKEGKNDPDLYSLFFQYGRYLLIASSRENSPLPANLQGIWNDNLACNMIWNCDYHLDINTEQNYWASNVTNLAECNTPFFNFIQDLSVSGEATAGKVYGCPGWVAHTVANVWGYTAPGQGVGWGLFPTAGSWMASHLWSHYCYTQDVDFLRNKAYPILKKSAVFFLNYMVEDPSTGYLMTGPSTSPENSFNYNGNEISLSMMPTCDRVLVYELYNSCIEASEILKTDSTFRDSLVKALAKFPPIRTGKNGTIQEWFSDYEDAHPNHRHSSHLLALYPFSQISLNRTPELAKAAKKTIENKLNAQGWENVEFSRANMACFYARLKDGNEAYNNLKILLGNLTRENLLTVSPKGIAGAPWDIFIFDGNEASTTAIAEMLIQNHEGYIEFLPALPTEWNNGQFKGLCVKGGAEVDLKWKNGFVQNAVIKAKSDYTYKIKLSDKYKNVTFYKNGKLLKCNIDKTQLITVPLKNKDFFEIIYK
jgi:alpha-L-fucosidase 2